jgi:YVTN family beta-propeller protein
MDIVLISPSEALNYSSTYNIHFGAITDMKGNELEDQSATQFSTEEPDTEHPYVLDIIPQDEESQVSVTSTVLVFFNEPMNVSSVENGFSLLDDNGTTVEGEPVWNTEGKVMEYVPDRSLSEDMSYTVTIPAGILDKSGLDMKNAVVAEFTTVGSAKPTLLYLGPEDDPNGLKGISVETSVLAEFTEPININTINYSTFNLVGPDGMGVEGSFDFFDENRSVVFWPDEPLQYNEEYTINLTTGIHDVSEPSQTFAGTISKFHTASGDIDPTIEYLEPYFGVAGSEVTIGGAGFSQITSGNTVKFGEMEAAVLSASTDYLTFRVPYEVEVEVDGYPVTVTVGDETSGSKDFIVVDPTDNPSYDEGVYSSTGSNTRSVAIPPDAAYAYATNWGSGTVTVLDMSVDPPAWVMDIEEGMGDAPAVIDINPEGTRAYVTNFLSNTVSVINIEPNTLNFHKVIKTIPVGYHPYGIAVSSDRKVYVANNATEYVSVIDVDPESGAFDHVVYNTKTGTNNRNVAVTPDAGLVLVTGLNGVNIIDSDPLSPTFNQVIASAASGSGTRGVRVTPDAALAIATTDLGDILFIDIYQPPGFQFGSAIASVRTGSSPRNILISADAATVYITNPEDNSVSIYKLDYSIIPGYGTTFDPDYGLELITTISDIDAPFAIASDPELKYILVTHDTYEGGVTKFTIGSDPIKTLEDLIQSVYRAIHYERVDRKIGFKLIQDLQATLERVEAEDYGPAIDQLDNFIKRVDRYVKLGQIPEEIAKEWRDAAFRIRDELVKYAKGNKDFTGAADTDKVEITDNYSNQSLTSQIPADFTGKQDLILEQNRPNPFSNQTMIYFEIPSSFREQIPIMMRVYNTSGQIVKTLVNMDMKPGRYSVIWNSEMDDGALVPEGLYLLELRSTDQREVITLSVIK